jgi:hypothetical protein
MFNVNYTESVKYMTDPVTGDLKLASVTVNVYHTHRVEMNFITVCPDGTRQGPPEFIPTASVTRTDTYLYLCNKKNYTVKLAPAKNQQVSSEIFAEVEPQKTTHLVAYVYDQSGNNVPGIDVRIESTVVARSGGHEHDDEARHTKHMGKLGATSGSLSASGAVLTGTTTDSGLPFSFEAPAPAGDHKILVSCTNCKQEGPNGIWVGIKGLEHIGSGSWDLVGSGGAGSYHPGNHYLKPLAIQKLKKLAEDWKKHRGITGPAFAVNDASLVRGGLFDCCEKYTDRNGRKHDRNIEGWWSPPHGEHRKGTVVDMHVYNEPDANRRTTNTRFVERAKLIGVIAQVHTAGTGRHYHVLLLERAE